MMGNKDATDAAFSKAKHIVSRKLNNNRIIANSIEPRAAIGLYHPESDSYTLYSTSQNPHGTRSRVAGNVLKIPENKLRVIAPDVGGGFGMKNGGYPEDALVVWASRRCGGRPVKWVSTRSEAFLSDTPGAAIGMQRHGVREHRFGDGVHRRNIVHAGREPQREQRYHHRCFEHVRAHVVQRVYAQAEDLAVLIERQFADHDLVTPVRPRPPWPSRCPRA